MIITVVYVDDLLITRADESTVQFVKSEFYKAFTIKDMGLARYFLGLEISSTPRGLMLNQRKYIHDLLIDANLLDCKAPAFPLPRTEFVN